MKENHKLIAVDLDQTLSDTLQSLIEWHNRTYDTSLVYEQFDTLDYWKVWGGTREESCLKLRAFYESKEFDEIKPIKDFSLEALKMFKKRGFQLVIITSRQQFIAEKTKRFVDRHYPGIFESLYFCNLNLSEKDQRKYVSKSKSLICQEIGVDVLIDDSLKYAIDCCNQVLLYDKNGTYKWNQTLDLPSHIHRVFDWKNIVASFPKPASPLKHCIYSFEGGEQDIDYFHDYQYRPIIHSTYKKPMVKCPQIEIESESSEEEELDELDELDGPELKEIDEQYLRDNFVYI